LLAGSFFPSLLEPGRQVDWALWAVLMEVYVSGVFTLNADELVVVLGGESGISHAEVRRFCQALDPKVRVFL
jgi:transposase-like protein